MNRVLAVIKSGVNGLLGLNDLPEGNRRFLATHLIFILFTTIPGVFINTFFFRQDGRISTVAIYNGITCFGAAVTMQFSSYVAIKKSPAFVVRVGVVLFNVFYLTLLLLQTRAVAFMPLLGILCAVSNGFYWQGYNMLLQSFTHNENLNKTLSLVGISQAVVSLIVPTLSGLIITRLNAVLGYSVIFLLSFLFSLYTTRLSYKIPVVKVDPTHNLWLAYRRVMEVKSWRLIFFSEFFRGMREISFPLLLSLVFFKYIENEAVLGANTTICGLAAILSFYAAGKIIKQGNRVKCVVFASTTMTLLYLLLFVQTNAWLIFALSVVNSLLVTYIQNPTVSVLFSHLKKVGRGTNFGQIMAAHEIYLAVGRLIGLAAMVLLSAKTSLYVYAFLFLNLTAFVSAALLKRSIQAGETEDARLQTIPETTDGEKESLCESCQS